MALDDAAGPNPFDQIGGDVAPQTSFFSSALHEAERGVLPLVAGASFFGPGTSAGATIGAFGGPFAPITVPAGGLIGGVGSMLVAGYAANKAQSYAISKLPDSWQEAVGQDEATREAEARQHPGAVVLGGLLPMTLLASPGGLGRVAQVAENSTALQRLMANPATARMFGGTLMGGMELAQEKAEGDPLDWRRIAAATAFGTVFNKPTRLGEALSSFGHGLPSAVTPEAAPAIEAAGATLAQAGDAKVLGPGITEEVFRGEHAQDPEAEMRAQEMARTEASVLGPPAPGPDLHEIARRLDPETFGAYVALSGQRDTFRARLAEAANPLDDVMAEAAGRRDALQQQLDAVPTAGAGRNLPEARRLRAQIRDAQREIDALNERRAAFAEGRAVETPETAALRQQLQVVDYRMRDLAPQVASAYRTAAEAHAVATVPAEFLPQAPAPASPAPFASMAEMLAARDPQGPQATAGAGPAPPSPTAPVEAPAVPGRSTTIPEPAGAPDAATARGDASPSSQVPAADAAEPGAPARPAAVQPSGSAVPIEQQRAFIIADVVRHLLAAGRTPEEAQAAGQLLAARYETRADRFRGALGTPEDLYRREAPQVRREGRPVPPLAPARPRVPGEPAPVEAASTLQHGIAAGPGAAPLMPTVDRPTIGRTAEPAGVELLQKAHEAPEAGEPAKTPTRPSDVSAGGIEALDPAEIGVDAGRFQYKAGGDASGVTERLQGVKAWDPRLAGTALVFREADGRLFVADGHQRVGLAKRLAAEGQSGIRVNSFVLDAADGGTASDARAIAAAKNIAEGSGTAIDAAKVIREAREGGITPPPLPPRSALVRDGQALARLGPDAFGMAVNEVVPTGQAALVGRLMTDPLQQAEAMRVLAKLGPDNLRQAEMVVREIAATGTEEMTRQGGLFGDEHFASSIVLERAKIADEAMKQLRRDKTTFRTLVAEAERIEGAGATALDRGANEERLSTNDQAADLFTSLATRAGPVSDALSGIARRFKSGDLSAVAAGREFLGALRR